MYSISEENHTSFTRGAVICFRDARVGASPVGERGERVFNGAAGGGLVSVEETRPAAAVGRADVVSAVGCDTATVAAGTRTDVTPLPNGMRIVRGKDEHATKLVSLKSTEASGMGSLEPDAEVAKAAERLHVGRLGHRFAKRAFDIVFSAADRRLNATTGATRRRRWGGHLCKGPGFYPPGPRPNHGHISRYHTLPAQTAP